MKQIVDGMTWEHQGGPQADRIFVHDGGATVSRTVEGDDRAIARSAYRLRDIGVWCALIVEAYASPFSAHQEAA